MAWSQRRKGAGDAQPAGGKMEAPAPGVRITIGPIGIVWTGERKGTISRLTAENGGSNGPGSAIERLSSAWKSTAAQSR